MFRTNMVHHRGAWLLTLSPPPHGHANPALFLYEHTMCSSARYVASRCAISHFLVNRSSCSAKLLCQESCLWRGSSGSTALCVYARHAYDPACEHTSVERTRRALAVTALLQSTRAQRTGSQEPVQHHNAKSTQYRYQEQAYCVQREQQCDERTLYVSPHMTPQLL